MFIIYLNIPIIQIINQSNIKEILLYYYNKLYIHTNTILRYILYTIKKKKLFS